MEDVRYHIAVRADALRNMLYHKVSAEAGSVTPSITPLARVTAKGDETISSKLNGARDYDVDGGITPHVRIVEQA